MSIKFALIAAAAAAALLNLPSDPSSPFETGTTAAQAAETMPFDQASFDAAQKAGKPILVEITAPWCTTCAAQRPILAKLFAQPKFKDLVTFNIDFDSQKALVHKFGATMQSTLIAYKGAKEEARSTGETKPDAIASLLDSAV
ncbi:thioredoxin family protein [Beijerinckia sp. L45]|jgi:thioredoxin 1|uniref:thioredoxin family protein n=1 Tax=Beijerinckia sp. L45 TaxID=1641855 RepID=UPI00131E4F95|nr:thioredoxin family protein [Beijerinckia sp. L45]